MPSELLPSKWRQAIKLGATVLLLAIVLRMAVPTALIGSLARFPLWAIAAMLLFLMINLLLVSFRFWRVLEHFGFRLPWAVASQASIAGHAAALVVVSLFGQVAGRQSVLESMGVPPMVNASISVYERGLLALSSGALCVLGGIYLLGQPVVAEFVSSISLMQIMSIGGLATLVSYLYGGSRFEADVIGRLWSGRNFRRIAEIFGITLAGQFMVLASFVIGIMALALDIGFLNMLGSAAIISFAASIPITINGWGVREMAAVFVLGHLGVPAADAMTVSVMVGLASTLVIIFFVPFNLRRRQLPTTVKSHTSRMHDLTEIEKVAAWALCMAAAVAVFFQAHISLPGGIVNVNLADPLAVLALAAMAAHTIFSRQFPVWRVPHFNLALLILSLSLSAGFVVGWIEVGVTQWALGGRLFGWLILLGYLSAGYFLIEYFGARGLRRFIETIAITAAVIVLYQGALRMVGLNTTLSFEGYAANRNAFAFQLMVVLVFLLVYSTIYIRRLRGDFPTRRGTVLTMLFAVFIGVTLTGSRAGWLSAGVLLLLAWWRRFADRKLLASGLVLAILFWGCIWLTSNLSVDSSGDSVLSQMQPSVSGFQSDDVRWLSYRHAIELWSQFPILGAGLGTFLARSGEWLGSPLVIHSTPLWILVELGLVGLGLFGGVFLMLIQNAVRNSRTRPEAQILLLLLVGFSIFGLVHEILYQRIFWLALGVLLARGRAR